MKIFWGSIAFMVLMMLAGCRHSTEPSGAEMYVNMEVESDFQNDDVVLTLDNWTLLHARITTNYTIDLAWSSGMQKLSREPHTLSFTVVNYNVRKEFIIGTAADSSTVFVRFNKTTRQIDFEQIKGRILRD